MNCEVSPWDGGSRDRSKLYIESFARKVLCCSRMTASKKRCIKECAECNRRFRGCPAKQQMVPLPRIRLEMTWRPFTNCATDFAGPFYTMQGWGRPRMKCYLCLFVCLQTHCCHLEMATSLEKDAFLNLLMRMVSWRGWPKLMLSDNGSNYVGATQEIKELVDCMDQEKLQRLTCNKGVTAK